MSKEDMRNPFTGQGCAGRQSATPATPATAATAKRPRGLSCLQRYRRARAQAKALSLLAFVVQTAICFLLLGPLVSAALLGLLKLDPSAALFWQLLLAAPTGFALSLLVGRRPPPLACLPLRRLPSQTKVGAKNWVPNRVFFAPPLPFGGKLRSRWFWLLLAPLLGSAAIAASNGLGLLLLFLFPDLPSYQSDAIQQLFHSLPRWQVYLLVVLLPAVFEELVFRGRGLALLMRCWNAPSAVLISGLLFAAAHASPPEAISLLPLGLFLAWLRWRSGSLPLAMLVHWQNNSLAFLWLTAQS